MDQALLARIREQLNILSKEIRLYIKGSISELQLADTSIRFFVLDEEAADSLLSIYPEADRLRNLMDITHPLWKLPRKMLLARNMEKLCSRILQQLDCSLKKG